MNAVARTAFLAGFGLFAAVPLRADILILDNGKEMKGISEEVDGFIKFTNAQGTTKIPKARVKSLTKESLPQGHVRIGDEHRAKDKMAEAVASYQMALKLDPGFQPAKDALAAVDKAKAEKEKAMRKDDILQIDALTAEIKAHIAKGDYEKAEQSLEKSSALVPTEEQRPLLRALTAELYLAWAKDRLDKFDQPGAEDKLNIALAADPQNAEVVENLLKLWEGQADKQDKITAVYETVLDQNPDDQVVRRKVADLYYKGGKLENAANHYLTLYKQAPAKFKGTDLEGRLVENLDRLHRQYANDKNYDKAILFYNIEMEINPETDPSGLVYYEYLKMAQDVKAGDIDKRITLAEFATNNGMEQAGLDNYRLVLQSAPDNKKARAAIDKYAGTLIEQAQTAFNSQDYFLAKSLAERVRTEFAESKEAGLRAQQIVSAANNELQRIARDQAKMCESYIERADTYFNQGMVFYRDYFDTTRSSSTSRVSSPKRDATRYFNYAVQMYTQAMQICPNIKGDPTNAATANLAEAKRYLAQLNQPLPPLRGNWGRIIDPDNGNPNNDSTGRRR